MDLPYVKYYSWAIHTILYSVCCIEYTWLFVNAQCYAVLYIAYFKRFFFLAFEQFDSAQNRHNF